MSSFLINMDIWKEMFFAREIILKECLEQYWVSAVFIHLNVEFFLLFIFLLLLGVLIIIVTNWILFGQALIFISSQTLPPNMLACTIAIV